MENTFLTNDNVRIHYSVQGEGEKTLLFVHGWGGNKNSFNPAIEHLKNQYTIISYDHRGFGQSEKPAGGYHVGQLAWDLAQLIEHCKLEKVVLVGWSLGGVTAIEYLNQFGQDKVEKLVLVDVNAKVLSDETYNHGFYDGNYKKADAYDDLVKMATDFLRFTREMPVKGDMRLFDSQQREDFAQRVAKQNTLLPAMCLWLAVCETDLRKPMANLTLPVLFFHGGTSTYCPPKARDYVASLIQNITVAEFPECSHFLPIEKPKEFAAAIQEFVNEQR